MEGAQSKSWWAPKVARARRGIHTGPISTRTSVLSLSPSRVGARCGRRALLTTSMPRDSATAVLPTQAVHRRGAGWGAAHYRGCHATFDGKVLFATPPAVRRLCTAGGIGYCRGGWCVVSAAGGGAVRGPLTASPSISHKVKYQILGIVHISARCRALVRFTTQRPTSVITLLLSRRGRRTIGGWDHFCFRCALSRIYWSFCWPIRVFSRPVM